MPITKTKSASNKVVQRRSKGERTREKILMSAIEVLATQGIKGTTHRAIASHADIQLSLTTYYFKDIQELVQQAFVLNSNYMRERTDNILQKAFASFDSIDKTSLRKVSVKTELCEKLASMTANYLFENINTETTSLAVEQLMYTAMQVTPELKKLAHEHEESQLRPFTVLASYFNKKDPEIDAKMMRTIFSQLQYSQLPLTRNERSIEAIYQITRKLMGWIMGLKN
ncbi:MAG: TetR family transcriptional regulator [Colwellia sp.]|nr:TetR family transcriptional regulator [Colwellia sp.]MCW8866661.1 TetR family transcriptional regulator [Colwellia sp.]MCW9081479.1 TetR family transcriptional regulator [Colwellia sp.]